MMPGDRLDAALEEIIPLLQNDVPGGYPATVGRAKRVMAGMVAAELREREKRIEEKYAKRNRLQTPLRELETIDSMRMSLASRAAEFERIAKGE